MKIITLLTVSLLLAVPSFTAADSLRVEGNLNVRGIYFSNDGSTIYSSNDLLKKLTIGTVVNGTQAAATITGTAPNQALNLTLPVGPKGDAGPQGAQGPQGQACSPLGVVCAPGEIYVQTATGIQCGTVELFPDAIGICISGSCTKTISGTSATLKVSTANVPAGTLIAGGEFKIVLPIGVSPRVLSLSDNNPELSISASGSAANSIVSASYDGATRTLQVSVVRLAGGITSESVSIRCSIARGTTVTATDFQLTGLKAFDSEGAASISGVTSSIELILQ